MKFWDASAVVPLVVDDEPTSVLDREYGSGPMLVWWGTIVEVSSALARRERTGDLTPSMIAKGLTALERLSQGWREIPPSEQLRRTAQRLLRVHSLRAADSLQLAAALAAAGTQPGSLAFVCWDARLAEAAAREGFRVIGP